MSMTVVGDGEDEFTDDIDNMMRIWVESVHVKVRRCPRSIEGLLNVDGADADLAIMETSFCHLERRMRRHIGLQQRQRNALLPISRLPLELLARILFFSLQLSHSPVGYVKKLQNVAQVCTSWSELVKDTAMFWGVAASSDPTPAILRAVSKSRDAPLDVWYFGRSGAESQRASFLKTVVEHSQRWRSLCLSGADRDVEDRLMQLSTPILHDLEINHDQGLRRREGLKGDFFVPNEKLYPLRHLELSGRPILWEPSALSRLESLELRNLGPTGRPTMTHLVAILRASPGLVALTLDQLRLDDPDNIAHDNVPVELPKLTDLTLSRLPVRGLRDLLTRIHIPICRRLQVDCTYRPHTTVLDAQTAHLGPPIQAILSARGKAKLRLTPDKFELSTVDDAPNVDSSTPNVFIYLLLPSDPSRGLMVWMNLVISSMIHPPTINLIIEAPKWSSELTPPPLDILPYVDLLHIIESEREAAAWIKLLSERVVLADGEARWTLSRMTRLVFHSCSPDANDLIGMIRSRYGRRGGSMVISQQDEAGTQPQSSKDPAPLKQLQVTGYNPLNSEDLEQLESIVGSACKWDNNDEGEGLDEEDEEEQADEEGDLEDDG
ncbi:hypothetical protein FRB97_002734 [Tulasnella sp. 331]|nr:hypothetical protein FRB97_002734 [Tulasnella sp. 331]